MIILDHLLLGVAISLPTNDPVIIGVTVFGSIFPDLDTINARPGTIKYLQKHRTVTHSTFLSPLYALLIALFASLIFSGYSIFKLGLWSLLGIASHLLVDIFNSFGTMIFYPVKRKIHIDLIYEFDPVISLIFLSICIQFYFISSQATLLLVVNAILVILYYLFRFYSRHRFLKNLSTNYKNEIENAERIFLVPAKYWRWKGIIVLNNEYLIYRKINKKLKVEKSPVRDIPEEYKTEEVMAYKNYARALDFYETDDTINIHNLIYSPSVYMLTIKFKNKLKQKVSISLPNIKFKDY
jgi:inner membrane protein